MSPALTLLLLAQGAAVEVTSSVDRTRVGVGEEVVMTIRAIGRSTAAFRANLPAFDGFALVEQKERTDIAQSGREIMRAYTLEIRLRAEQVGTWTLGPILVEHGQNSAWSAPEQVSVTSASSFASAGLDADLLALIPRVPEPRVGRPSVYVILSDDQVFSGDQVNVLTAAWLPRGLRLRLRQPPTLTPPALPGVFSAPRVSVPGAVASRTVDGELYDLFVGFQTVYPLNPGVVSIPSARLSWVEPGGRQASGEDRRLNVESGPVVIEVRELPATGRPSDFDGPTARDLRIEYRLDQGAGRAGSPLPVEIVLSGAGNLLLWSAPTAAWPASSRVYEEGNETTPRSFGQRLGGTRRFRYSVVPDSAGSLSLPSLEYPWFDPVSQKYRVSRTPGIVVPVLDALPVSERREVFYLKRINEWPFVVRIFQLPQAILVSLIAIPFLGVAGVLIWRRRAGRVRPTPQNLGSAERLEAMILRLTPPGARTSPEELSAALRRAGMPRDEAERMVALHAALSAERFGPTGNGAPSPELLQRIEKALAALPPIALRAAALGLLLCLTGAVRLEAQDGITGTELFRARRFQAAAEAFRAAPPSQGRWYNVALSEYMARRDAQAVAALLEARAAAPRDGDVRALWNSLAREHELLRRTGRSWPFSPEEAFAVALGALWLALMLVILVRRTYAPAIMALLVAAVGLGAGVGLRREAAAPRAVLSGNASLRLSPHGLAPERTAVPAFSIVSLTRQLGPWWLVETRDGARGWVPAEILAPTPR